MVQDHFVLRLEPWSLPQLAHAGGFLGGSEEIALVFEFRWRGGHEFSGQTEEIADTVALHLPDAISTLLSFRMAKLFYGLVGLHMA